MLVHNLFLVALLLVHLVLCGGFDESNVSLSSRTTCSGAPACGTVLASYNNIPAYSNGALQCSGNSCNGYGTYGYQYQCVELAQRYFSIMYGTAAIWYANAIDMCTTHPPNVYPTSSPNPGDLIVLNTDPPYGHVAVITGVNYGVSVNVIEQNADISGRNTYTWSLGYCFLTANQTSSGGSGGASCAGLASGYYCGNNGVGGTSNTLYLCSNGAIASQAPCSQVCETFPPGYDDKCATGNCSGMMNGYYCGNDGVYGSDPSGLYLCQNGAVASVSHCASGCVSQPSGYSDYCA